MVNDATSQAKQGGALSRTALYNMAQKHAPRAIEVLQELMGEKHQPSVRMGAAKVLLAKAIPDLKAMEIAGKDGEQLKVFVIPSELMEKYGITQNAPQNPE